MNTKFVIQMWSPCEAGRPVLVLGIINFRDLDDQKLLEYVGAQLFVDGRT